MGTIHLNTWQKMTQSSEDEKWIRSFLAGDASAFDTLYHKYYQPVYRICFGVLLHREDAHDAAQEVFTILHKSLHTFDFKASFYTWLYRIAFNRAIHVKRAYRHRKREVGMPPEFDQVSDENLQNKTAEMQDFAILLQNLGEEDRGILVLHYWEDQSIKEIAATVGCSETAAKTRLFRAREKLKKQMIENPKMGGQF